MFHSLLHKKLGLTTKDKSYRQAFLVLSTLSVAGFVITFYIFYNLFITKLYYIAALEAISLFLISLSWYLLVQKQKISLSSTLLLFTIFTLTLLFIIDHKHRDYAFAQAVMFPVLAIYLKGLRVGTLISALYIAAVLGIAFFGIDQFQSVPFTPTSFTNLSFTYIVVILLVYYFELSRVEAFNIIQRSHQELLSHQNNLELKVQEAVEEKHQQEQLLIQQSKMALMGEMVASISQQWRQPLTTISSILNEAKIKHELSKEFVTDDFFESLQTQIAYMDQTLSDFSRIFKPDRKKEFFSLRSSIQDVQRIVIHQLQKNRIKLINGVENDQILIEGYKNEFSQVLLGLISNAKDAIFDNIEIGGISSISGEIEIRADFSDNRLRLSVCDNGTGVPQEIVDKIFDAYYTSKKEANHAGIGLYMAKIIIDAHNGKISTLNTEKGACFILELSAVKRHESH